jgi:16S rRNA processing protein RimM
MAARRKPTSKDPDDVLPAAPAVDETLVVGVVVGAFGLRGEMKVRLETEVPDRFKAGAQLLVRRAEGSPLMWVELLSSRPHKGHVLVSIPAVQSPEEVAQWRGAEFRIPMAWRRKLEANSYYLYELEGMSVLTEDGTLLGHIVEIWQPGGADVYVVKPRDPGERRWLIPAVSDFVRRVDVPSGQMWVRVEEALRE